MGLFKALRTVFGVVSKANDVIAEVTPVIGIAEAVVNEVGKAAKPSKKKVK